MPTWETIVSYVETLPSTTFNWTENTCLNQIGPPYFRSKSAIWTHSLWLLGGVWNYIELCGDTCIKHIQLNWEYLFVSKWTFLRSIKISLSVIRTHNLWILGLVCNHSTAVPLTTFKSFNVNRWVRRQHLLLVVLIFRKLNLTAEEVEANIIMK